MKTFPPETELLLLECRKSDNLINKTVRSAVPKGFSAQNQSFYIYFSMPDPLNALLDSLKTVLVIFGN